MPLALDSGPAAVPDTPSIAISSLAYLHALRSKCLLSEAEKDFLGILGMGAADLKPALSADQLEAAVRAGKDKAEHDLAENKPQTCASARQLMEKAAENLVSELGGKR